MEKIITCIVVGLLIGILGFLLYEEIGIIICVAVFLGLLAYENYPHYHLRKRVLAY